MVLFPDVQKKAQDEIDRIVGGNRLPTFGDKSSLPYISRIVLECLRWNPVTPLGVAHCLTEDDEYSGYRIPKGSTILPNIWYGGNILILSCTSDLFIRAMFHDEHVYPEPFKFNPDRFENQDTNKLTGINELPHIAFGFARRCVIYIWA
jgi:cytochrome P450